VREIELAVEDKWAVEVGVVSPPREIGGTTLKSKTVITVGLLPSLLGEDELSAPGLVMLDRALGAAQRKKRKLTNALHLLPSSLEGLAIPPSWRPFQLIFGYGIKYMDDGEPCVLMFRFREDKWEKRWYRLYYEHWDGYDRFLYTDTEQFLGFESPC